MEYFELQDGYIINLSKVLFIGRTPEPEKEYIVNMQGYGEFFITEYDFNRLKKRLKPKFVFRISS